MTDTSSMGEIPADVMKTAMRIKAECNVDFGGGIGGGAIIRMIADGILRERERCAKAAIDYDLVPHPRLSAGSEMNAWWSGQEKAAERIKAAIEAGAA